MNDAEEYRRKARHFLMLARQITRPEDQGYDDRFRSSELKSLTGTSVLSNSNSRRSPKELEGDVPDTHRRKATEVRYALQIEGGALVLPCWGTGSKNKTANSSLASCFEHSRFKRLVRSRAGPGHKL